MKKVIVCALILICLTGCMREESKVDNFADDLINNSDKIISTQDNNLEHMKDDMSKDIVSNDKDLMERKDTINNTEEYYKNKLKEFTERKVEDIVIDDFDGDGENEAFIFTADSYYNDLSESIEYNGEIWFVTRNKVARLIDENKIIAYKDFIKIIDAVNGKLIKVDSHHPSASVSYIWEMKDGIPNQILNGALYLNVDENNSVYAESSSYDHDYDNGIWTGHTWKNYWFYIDNGIKEYGALEIGLKDFNKFDGAEAIIEEIAKAKEEIVNILYRKNNIININVVREYGNNYRIYDNYILSYDKTSVKKIGKEEGIYKIALWPEVATYPSEFVEPKNDKTVKYTRVTEISEEKLFLSTLIEKNGEDYLIKGELVSKLTIPKAYIDMKLKLKEKVYCSGMNDEIYEPQLVSDISGSETYVLGTRFDYEIGGWYGLDYDSTTNSYDVEQYTEFSAVWNWDDTQYIEFIIDKDAHIIPYYEENLIAIKDFYLSGNHVELFGNVIFENGKCVEISETITGH